MPQISRDKLYAEIGKRIRAARNTHEPKLTQDGLAEKLGVERTSITNIESGIQRATLHFLYRVAQELKIPLSTFLPDVASIFDGNVTALEEIRGLDKNQKKTVPTLVKNMYDNLEHIKGDM